MAPETGNEKQWDVNTSCSQHVATDKDYKRLLFPMGEQC